MKKLIDYLEMDRDRVMSGLQGAATPAAAQEILEKEADRLLLQYNEECTSVRIRDAASGMLQALRSSVPFLDSAGEAQVWQRDGSVSGGAAGAGTAGAKGKSLSGIFLVVGAVLTVAAFAVPALSVGGTAAFGALLKGILLPVAGGGCLYAAGRTAGSNTRIGIETKSGKNGSREGTSRRIEIMIDPEKLWSSLRGAVMVIDRNLETVSESEAYDRRKDLDAASGAKGISAEEVELFSGLLEMADAESPQMAADIRYYLHKKNIDVLPWTEQNAAWFEMLPAAPGAFAASGPNGTGTSGSPGGGSYDIVNPQAVTIRPALAQNGKLLKKGLAVR
ncbi:MAG: hypothetical protein Q4D81_11205 [Eubacteriales bacterium]|nr:hypothetical protein [Eubacteriales bacterium]